MNNVKPIIRWVGGKRRLSSHILQLIPNYSGFFIEPFVGGGTMFLTQLHNERIIANDINAELINFYVMIQTRCNDVLQEYYKFNNSLECYKEVRSWDRDDNFIMNRSTIERAARFLFLNKASFQGLWRLNLNGQHNVPYCKPRSIAIVHQRFIDFSNHIKNVEFTNDDFEGVLLKATSNDFVYADPPYVPISESSSFTAYSQGGFSNDHVRLRDCCIDLNRRSVRFVLSNSDCDESRELYKMFNIQQVGVKRLISAKSSSRSNVTEIIVKNF